MPWISKANLKGADGLNATGAAEDDAAIAAFMAAPGSATAAQLRKTITARANTFVIIGSSLEEQNGMGAATLDASGGSTLRARGWFHWFRAFVNGAATLVYNAGVGGNRYDQMLARFDADVLTHESDWVGIGSPTNDVTAGRTVEQITADLNAMLDKSINAGRRVVVHLIPPRDSFTTAAKREVVAKVNAYIADLAFTRRGVIPVDIWTPLADPATGAMMPGMSIDGTHYSIGGAARLGKATADALRNHLVPRPPRNTSSVDPLSVLANPQFLTSGAGWTALSGSTVTYETAAEGHGNKCKVAVTGNTSASATRGVTTTELLSAGRFAVGDIVQASVRVKWSNLVPLDIGTTTDCAPQFLLRHKTGAAVTYTAQALYSAQSEWLAQNPGMPTSGEVLLTSWRSTVGPTIDAFDVILGWRGAASVNLEFEHLAFYKAA